MAYWTHYWTNKTVEEEEATGSSLMNHTADNRFRLRGVRPKDVVYVVTNIKGTVFEIGRLVVEQVVDEWEAEQILDQYVWSATDHLIAKRPLSRCRYHVSVPRARLGKIEFISSKGTDHLKFDKREGADPRAVDRQTLRGVREITESTAGLFDSLLS